MPTKICVLATVGLHINGKSPKETNIYIVSEIQIQFLTFLQSTILFFCLTVCQLKQHHYATDVCQFYIIGIDQRRSLAILLHKALYFLFCIALPYTARVSISPHPLFSNY